MELFFFHYTCPVHSVTADISSLYRNCDSTTIQRYHDAFDYDGSDRNYDVFNSTAVRLRRKNDMFIFCLR